MPLEIKQVAGSVPMHVLAEDAFEKTPDGRDILVGRAGQSIPLVRAQQLGLVKKGPETAPSEAKVSRRQTTSEPLIGDAPEGAPSALDDPAERPAEEALAAEPEPAPRGKKKASE